MINKFFTSKITRKKLDKLIEEHKTNELILDLGSAKSPYSKWFPNRITVDIHPESGADIIADAHNLPIEDNKFSFILCTEMLEHMSDPKRSVEEIFRILKPCGTLVLSTRFVFPIHHSPYDYYRFTKYGLLKLFEKFEIVSIVEETENFETIGVLLQRISYQSDFLLGKIVNIFLLIIAKIMVFFNYLIVKQYGQRSRFNYEKSIICSGYFLVCKKK